jgi:hypothetical protein
MAAKSEAGEPTATAAHVETQPQIDEIAPAEAVATGAPQHRVEKAAAFLASHGGGSTFTYEEEKQVLSRIDRRVLPILLGAYFFQQLDKSSLR